MPAFVYKNLEFLVIASFKSYIAKYNEDSCMF